MYHRPSSKTQYREKEISSTGQRIIFPSLHGITINTHHKSNVGVEHQRGKSIDNISPTDVIKPAPVLRHANSLDGLMIPMPKLSINDTNKSNEEFFAPKILNQRTNDVQISSSTPPRASEPLFRHSISGGSNFDNAKSSSRSISSTKSNVSYYGDARKHRTYYYPASVPTPISQKKSPLPSAKPKRLIPILRRRTLSLSPSTKVFSTSCGTEPTLASPDIIKTLHSHDNYLPLGIPRATINGDKKEGIGESEYGLERIRDCPKLIHRSKCEIKKSQSDSLVSQPNEEDLTRPRRNSISTDKCVSRHASVEAFQHSKRCSFDPHITVFQFPISQYESKGGEKWFTADELAEFKQEAIQRIRLRSMKVIPTGTGRALAISPTQNGANKEKSGKASGSVFFNHPALGCDEELDPGELSKEWQLHTDLSKEIRNILVVDPHEIFLALFTKSLNHIIPHAAVATAKSTKEALSRIEAAKRAFPPTDRGATLGFDIIIIEERLKLPAQQLASGIYKSHDQHSQTAGDDSAQQFDMTSGSSLIRYLTKGDSADSMRLTLIVGVSANKTDHTKLKHAGADCVWGKPPPKMNSTLRNDLLKLLIKKRRYIDK